MTEQNNALAITTILNEQPGTSLCSVDMTDATPEQRKIVYNAMNNPENKLSDFINKKIKIENIYLEVCDFVNNETGEIDRAPKIVLISPDGKSYFTTAKGILNSINNACHVLGAMPWPGGYEFEVKQRQVGKGKMLTLEMV